MVNRKNLNKKFVLISVYNKKNLKLLCQNLQSYGYDFISTGSTYNKIKNYGFKCLNVSKISKYKEILDGRVKTLNPKIFGSILFKRNNQNHINEFKKLNFPEIKMVIVNFYPFSQSLQIKNEDDIIEMIDIGGVSLVRAASKNFRDVTVICKTNNYSLLIKNLKKNNGYTDINFRKKMAASSFKIISNYDKVISSWFDKKTLNKNLKLKYGENPNQQSFLINNKKNNISSFQISGKKLSYNNIIDVDSGLKCLNEFSEPTCVIIKHTNPCGVASSKNINDAFKKAYASDKQSAFGGVVLLNKKINEKLAQIISKHFFEVIVMRSIDKKALNILESKKKLILLKIDKLIPNKQEHKSTIFGTIYQNLDQDVVNKNFIKLVSNKKSNQKILDDLIFSLKVVKHLKSNAVVLSKNKQTIGLGMGQVSRINAVKLAISQSKKNFITKQFVCASDGFFPFLDSIKLLNKNKCICFAQPSGSINDQAVIEYAKKNKLSLYFTKNRLFKH